MTEAQWRLIEPLLPKEPKKEAKVTLMRLEGKYVILFCGLVITGFRWCDVPKGEQWGSSASSHRWLGRWQIDGTLDKIKILITLIETTNLAGLIDWQRLSVNVFFLYN